MNEAVSEETAFSSVQERQGYQQLSYVVESEIGDAERKLRHTGEGVEDEYDIRGCKQHSAYRIDPGSL